MVAPQRVPSNGLGVRRIAAPAPCPSAVLTYADPEARPFALVSGEGDRRLSAWSYAGIEACGDAPSLEAAEAAIEGWIAEADPLEVPPFAGGAVGYVGYDLGWPLQARPRAARPDPLDMPSATFGLYDAIYARSNVTGEGFVISQPTIEAEARAERLSAAVRGARSSPRRLRGVLESPLSAAIARAAHVARIEEALALIADGEIYQANLTYPLVARFAGDPEAAFLRVLRAAPPFAAFLRVSRAACVVSASPECFFDLDRLQRTISVYPIKGTRPRARDPAADRAFRDALVRSEKERAEHLMIVDLLRNDLGRAAVIGSVRVDGLAYVESFPRIHHLTSRIVATLDPRTRASAAMRALFPGGSITGVPKLRAMEVIDRLENDARGVYTGAIVYLAPNGSARASIAIRTAQIARGEVRFGVGGGIVADSDPEAEWTETIVKSDALGEALRG
jgi:para-aminobenzoate synthetase component 1